MKWPWQKKVINQTFDLNDDKLFDLVTEKTGLSISGISVTEKTAMKFSAVYACVSLLAGTIASLPCVIKTDRKGFDEVLHSSRLRPLLNRQPNITMSAYVFWEAIYTNMFLSGNGYALIIRYKTGEPRALYWVPAERTEPRLNKQKNRLIYQMRIQNKSLFFDQDDVLHFPCIGWDGLKGMSPITAAREGIGLGLAGEQFNSHYFTNAITSDVAITYPAGLTPTARIELEKYLKERYSSLDNLRKPFIGMNGAVVTNLGMNASDAQMIEGRDYQVEDICRFYGVPPWLVGAMKKTTSWGTGLSEQVLGFVKFTLRKHLKRIEQEIDRKIIRDSQKFCKFNLDALLRADIETRNKSYQIALGGNQYPGYMSKNEIRKIEGLPPDLAPESDQLYNPPDKITEGKQNAND